MNDETNIVWKLSKADKGRYVLAARKANLPLIGWLKSIADAHSEPVTDDPGQGGSGDVARRRPSVDADGGRSPGNEA